MANVTFVFFLLAPEEALEGYNLYNAIILVNSKMFVYESPQFYLVVVILTNCRLFIRHWLAQRLSHFLFDLINLICVLEKG